MPRHGRQQHASVAEQSADPRKRPAQRTCLKCRKPFASTHAGNRICRLCSRTEDVGAQVTSYAVVVSSGKAWR